MFKLHLPTMFVVIFAVAIGYAIGNSGQPKLSPPLIDTPSVSLEQALPVATPTTAVTNAVALTTTTPRPRCASPIGWQVYRVRAGDSIDQLAAAVGLSDYNLLCSNGLPSRHLRVGQAIHLPVIPESLTASRPLEIASTDSSLGAMSTMSNEGAVENTADTNSINWADATPSEPLMDIVLRRATGTVVPPTPLWQLTQPRANLPQDMAPLAETILPPPAPTPTLKPAPVILGPTIPPPPPALPVIPPPQPTAVVDPPLKGVQVPVMQAPLPTQPPAKAVIAPPQPTAVVNPPSKGVQVPVIVAPLPTQLPAKAVIAPPQPTAVAPVKQATAAPKKAPAKAQQP